MTNKLVYWDSCAFIHLFRRTAGYCEWLEATVGKARAKECLIVTSTVTMSEIYKLPGLGTMPIEQSDKILECLDNDYIQLWQADRFVCKEAHHIQRLVPQLLPMDAIHMATAICAKVSVIISTDTKKYRRNGLLIHDGKFGDPPIKIRLPGGEDIGELFAHTSGQQASLGARPEAQNAQDQGRLG